jgi:hypothetical protein
MMDFETLLKWNGVWCWYSSVMKVLWWFVYRGTQWVFLLEFNLHACNFIGWENGGWSLLLLLFLREREERKWERVFSFVFAEKWRIGSELQYLHSCMHLIVIQWVERWVTNKWWGVELREKESVSGKMSHKWEGGRARVEEKNGGKIQLFLF